MLGDDCAREAFGKATVCRLAAGAVECEADGPRGGGVALLGVKGVRAAPRWRPRPLAELEDDLSRLYGRPIGSAGKLAGLAVVAAAKTKTMVETRANSGRASFALE